MSELEIFKQFVDGMWEMTFGTERRTEGRYKADDKSTKEINEAWVGGKAPKKRKKNVKS